MFDMRVSEVTSAAALRECMQCHAHVCIQSTNQIEFSIACLSVLIPKVLMTCIPQHFHTVHHLLVHARLYPRYTALSNAIILGLLQPAARYTERSDKVVLFLWMKRRFPAAALILGIMQLRRLNVHAQGLKQQTKCIWNGMLAHMAK